MNPVIIMVINTITKYTTIHQSSMGNQGLEAKTGCLGIRILCLGRLVSVELTL